MSKKIEKKFIYKGLGFPIELHNVEMIEINGEYHPKIDIKKISDSAMENLITQKTRFTGNQVKFIRTYFSMSLREFSKVVSESHTAIMKWEKFGDKKTNMDINIEKILRLYIYDRVKIHTKKQMYEFYSHYKQISELHISS